MRQLPRQPEGADAISVVALIEETKRASEIRNSDDEEKHSRPSSRE
jgi:hypothetical protein